MKAEDLDLRELITFGDGSIDLYGRRLVLHSLHALGQFRQDLMETLGYDDARRAFTRFGFFWGQADAAALHRVMEWDDPLEMLRAALKLQAMEGFARPEIQSLEADGAGSRFRLEVTWHDSGEAEEHLIEIGWSNCPVCWELVGYASGCATFCLGKNIYFIEQQCQARADAFCSAVGMDEDSWGEELAPHLRYFEAEDIKGKVAELGAKLEKKTRELAKERKRLALLQQRRSPFLAESRSKAMEEVVSLAERVARFDTPVLITGETGVGKEIVGRHMHSVSLKAAGPFLAVNCGALPETLLESELFGHKKGSFTGAVADRIGLFEQASGGTIFLDEIGDITPAMQLKILRVLQEREIMRVGESRQRKVDARIVAATNRDLDRAVTTGRFRDDLLYRLRVVEIVVPPLRKRMEDLLPLARHIARKLSRRLDLPRLHLDSTVVDVLLSYPWPGNVRELENALERAAILSKEGRILPENLPPVVVQGGSPDTFSTGPTSRSLAQVEMEYIHAVLKATGGNRTRAARILGIGPTTLWRRLKKVAEV